MLGFKGQGGAKRAQGTAREASENLIKTLLFEAKGSQNLVKA